jgi:hypothetical protein
MAKSKKTKAAKKVSSVMHEWKTGTLHAGKGGPVVTGRQQAIAIALAQGRKAATRGRRRK